MRYNVCDLKQLKAAVAEMSADDRIVLFTDEGPFRFRIKSESIEKHECDKDGSEPVQLCPHGFGRLTERCSLCK